MTKMEDGDQFTTCVCGHQRRFHEGDEMDGECRWIDSGCSEECDCTEFRMGPADPPTVTLTDSQTFRFGSGDHIEPYEVREKGGLERKWEVWEKSHEAPGLVNRIIAIFYIEGMALRLANALNRRADAIYQAAREYQKVIGGSVAEILELVRAHAENLPEVTFSYNTANDWLENWSVKEGDDDGE